ncbi:LamG-like jellyroll fold domain-containing protein [Agromyces sp. Marseille-Q5079]|uniref:LamG-like jellyroll fold domain-containing protein n=1 Tax=Agromyces sp. Marseille-Q5079 TaxID=3439059 RepID=UPI003D9CB6A0
MGAPEPASSRLRFLSSAVIAAVIASGLTVAAFAAPAAADTAPPEAVVPATVSSDPLPAPQINGVVWDQEIVGNTVYVAGNFTKARPAGSAAGVNEVNRSHLLAFDINTGTLLPWAPTLNGQVRAIAASPDGKRLYAGGEFTQVNGATRNRIVAFDTATGNVATAFNVSANNRVWALDATNTTVYLSGHFSSVNSTARPGFSAAVAASNGAIQPWAPVLTGGRAWDLIVSPDATKVVIGGDFTRANGSDNPGYGLIAVNSTSGATVVPWNANASVRNAGTEAAVVSLESDGDSFYGSGYHYGGGGNLEGTFRGSWATGEVDWVADCHGDTYSVAAVGDTIYTAGHAHYCGNMGGYPQTEPWTFYRGIAYSKAATGVNLPDPYGYPDHAGAAAPSLLNWFPTINLGTFTGQYQGPWDVAADSRYAVYGGEFTMVNNKAFQGIVRFAARSTAPNLDGPRLTGDNFVPKLASPAAGVVTASWPANYDRDNERLTYQVIRDGRTATPVQVMTEDSRFYDRPTMTFVDTGLTPGQSYTYRLRAIDPLGNSGWGSTLSITASGTGSLSSYARTVIDDKPTYYWRFGDPSGTPSAADSVGRSNAVNGTGVTYGQPGAILGDQNTSAGFNGTDAGRAISQEQVWRDNSFSAEAWFKTTSTSGGKIVGYGSNPSGDSNSYDRHIYMTPQGKVTFGVYPNGLATLQSPKSYNDGEWHHVVGSMGANGMQLFVDGRRVGLNPDVTWGQQYWGYWRVGGDNTWEGDRNFNGAIDEVAVYPAPLTTDQVLEHYTASGRDPAAVPTAPADAYGAAVFAADPLVYFRLGESGGAVAKDASAQAADGSYVGTRSPGAAGALVDVGDTAVQFNGGFAVTSAPVPGSNNYSTEAWFKTTTTQGGKITGFGNSNNGLSSNYDRHVYMQDDGRLVFGTWTGFTNTITTDQPYNDGAWHQVVATQSSSAGMRLYVDGALVGTNGQTEAQGYDGYWRAGGDVTWGSSSPWFDGTIDEFAVYPTALSAATVQSHYSLGSTIVPNSPPTALFTSTVDLLDAEFDAGGSTDSDGTIELYEWDFGDGETGTGVEATHAYAEEGDYDVTLTVTDDAGATATSTATVTATAPPVGPVTLASDDFARTVSAGWGTATTGGAWQSTVNANYTVSGGRGVFLHAATGSTRRALLGGISQTGSVTQVAVTVDKDVAVGQVVAGAVGRQVGTDFYQGRIRLQPGGSVGLQLLRGSSVILSNTTIGGLTFAAGDTLLIKVSVTGTNPTTIAGKIWKAGTTEPAAWQATTTDATAAMQAAGSIGVESYISSSATNIPITVRFDDFVSVEAQ